MLKYPTFSPYVGQAPNSLDPTLTTMKLDDIPLLDGLVNANIF